MSTVSNIVNKQIDLSAEFELLKELNPNLHQSVQKPEERDGKLKRALVANRGEIAKRFFHCLREENCSSVALVCDADLYQSWHEQADFIIRIGDSSGYTNPKLIVAATIFTHGNAIYPGYGFLSEDIAFVRLIESYNETDQGLKEPIIFMGPNSGVMGAVGEKIAARSLAKKSGVPVLAGSELLQTPQEALALADELGMPLMVKLNSGGGGKGMFPVFKPEELVESIKTSQRIGERLYADTGYFLERLVQEPVHIEVQIFNGAAIGIRKCAVQRNNQKVIEESAEYGLDHATQLSLLAAAERMAIVSGYAEGCAAGTVEFLYDNATGEYGFLEMNTRLQVEHPVTEQAIGVDLAKWQVLHFDGRSEEIPLMQALEKRFGKKFHAIECRIYAEDPQAGYAPSPGKLNQFELPTFNAVRCDFGFRRGDKVLMDFDPMIGKLLVKGSTRRKALLRLERALREIYISGVITNIGQLIAISQDPSFVSGNYTNNLLKDKDITTTQLSAYEAEEVAVMAATCESLRHLQRRGKTLGNTTDLQLWLHENNDITADLQHKVRVKDNEYKIRLSPLNNDSFAAFIGDSHCGDVRVIGRGEELQQIKLSWKGRRFTARIDRKLGYQIVRITTKERLTYTKLSIEPLSGSDDGTSVLPCPFQATFVKFGSHADGSPLKIGDKISAGQEIITIAAMKMESAMKAQSDGILTQMIGDGDTANMVLSTTEDGLVIGKPIAEGDALFTVQPEGQSSDQEKNQSALTAEATTLWNELNGNPSSTQIAKLVPLISGPVLTGFLPLTAQTSALVDKSAKHLAEHAATDTNNGIGSLNYTHSQIEELYSTLSFYFHCKKLFTAQADANESYFSLVEQFLFDKRKSLNPSLRSILKPAWSIYTGQESEDLETALRSSSGLEFLFWLCQVHSRMDRIQPLVKELLLLFTCLEQKKQRTVQLLRRVIRIEQFQVDDSLAIVARDLLEKWGIRYYRANLANIRSHKYIKDIMRYARDPWGAVDGTFELSPEKVRVSIQSALTKPKPVIGNDDFWAQVPDWIVPRLKNLVAQYGEKYDVFALYSPDARRYLFLLKAKGPDEQDHYWTASFIDDYYFNVDDEKGPSRVEKSIINTAKLLGLYQSMHPLANNRVDIFYDDAESGFCLGDDRPNIINYPVLAELGRIVIHYFSNVDVSFTLMHFNAMRVNRHGQVENEKKILKYYYEDGKLRLDFMAEDDPSPEAWPYATSEPVHPKNERLYKKGKWTVEQWTRLIFDYDTSEEVFLDAVDNEDKPCGGRIYIGKVSGTLAVVYAKDSRINGGATGDREGRKYLGACLLAYKLGYPIYVLNDGAGANIKEGMISLDRAGQGFLMNSLLGNFPNLPFEHYINEHTDPATLAINTEIDTLVSGYKKDNRFPATGGRAFLIAVGTGSSTGLDVYGSSQAAVQIMVEDKESYRVLTGSNVIRSVTGEDFENYEIGGAHVMEKVTGTVDLLALNKLHLVYLIHKLQRTFAFDLHTEQKQLPPREPDTILKHHTLNPSTISKHLAGEYLQFKSGYLRAQSLIGGFGRLAGQPALIMGPRNVQGLRDFESATKAKELLRTSYKLNTHCVLFYGENFFRTSSSTSVQSLGAQSDFYGLWFKRPFSGDKVKIAIVTDIKGLTQSEVLSAVDFIILVSSSKLSPAEQKLADNRALLTVSSIEEALVKSEELIGLCGNLDVANQTVPKQTPAVPADPAIPYDMQKNIIDAVLDEGTMLEVWQGMNDSLSGPSLITGFGRLSGQAVAVIADQPIIMGGAPDALGTEKFRRFTDIVGRFNLPIIMLSNSPGFVPGIKQERLRIQQIGAESLDSNIFHSNPVVSVVINQNYGGRQIHAFSKNLRPGIVYLTLENSILAVMGGQASFDLFKGKEYRELLESDAPAAERLRTEYVNAYQTKSAAKNDLFKNGLVDRLIAEIADLRGEIQTGLKEAKSRLGA